MTRQPPLPARHLSVYDLHALGHLLPASARELVRVIGAQAAVTLLNALPGITLPVPKAANSNRHGARRWAQLVELVGPEATALLAAQFGGFALEINTCAALRCERRRRWLRAGFDVLTTGPGGLSKNHAIEQLGIELARAGEPMNNRSIEQAIDSADASGLPLNVPFNLPLFDEV
ncbi:hypothetical protein LNV08_11820 [Paucibacter sp. TC2R-5]|uniref:hypothetical protein n=1 Tax=Paucibacter sp. TC2R-5 TaxID=2893555 RepID=UPI0021E3B312|nr:hypothetical protein [Paucibacter sp. TC2R-5]MCV2359657.1 hypothetical protein [Paucibacter sp. TC2R-5]